MKRGHSYLNIAILALALSACSTPVDPNSCTTDNDCKAPGTRCNIELKQCICSTDEACDESEYCNRAGVCQEKPGCTRNIDCASVEDSYCDLLSGQCILGTNGEDDSGCGLDTHCKPGWTCQDKVCKPACYDEADCELGRICHNGMCLADTSLCADDSFCGYAERCTQDQCKRDRRGPFCRGCSMRSGSNPEPCDDSRNFCLTNAKESGGFSQNCGVDCSLGQECPNGFQCNFVLVLTQDPCRQKMEPNDPSPNAQCQCDPRRIGGPCSNNSQCNGGTCVFGTCCTGTIQSDRFCAMGEDTIQGFCTCASDLDCPRDSCDPSRGACTITGTPCTVGGDECGAIPCIEGRCQLGQNCTPVEGVNCSDVLNQ